MTLHNDFIFGGRNSIKRLVSSVLIMICISLLTSCKAQDSTQDNSSSKETTSTNFGSNTSPYSLVVKQSDGTTIQVLGKGNRHNPYTETIDGYTLLINNESVYEYAILGSNNQLVLSGVKANDLKDRSSEEREFLLLYEKHLRNR